MPLLALLLVLGSCALHATWNLLIKRAQDKQAFTALYLVAGLLIYLPLFLVLAAQHPVPRAGWACIAATGAVDAALVHGNRYDFGRWHPPRWWGRPMPPTA